jgi:hypothetical protein
MRHVSQNAQPIEKQRENAPRGRDARHIARIKQSKINGLRSKIALRYIAEKLFGCDGRIAAIICARSHQRSKNRKTANPPIPAYPGQNFESIFRILADV